MRIEKLIHALLFLPIWLGLLLAPAAHGADQFENLDRLDSLVALTVGANLGEPGGPAAPVDRRLRLRPCPATPKVDGPVFGAAVISCAEIGWRLRVALVPSAEPQSAAARAKAELAAEAVIKKGDPVELVAGNEVFSVSRLMVADEDGVVGQLIRVREDKRSQPVSAKVERAGVVRTPTI